ncbi:MAG TPA: class I SAM-dependent methyltransferase [Nannocystaceae bacterium]|nr:class I SAM-dependent methyltransferase [Nannocystaceae bacterium]
MSNWVTAHEQWVAWAKEGLVPIPPCEVVDQFDEELRELLVAAPFGARTELPRVARLGESMPFDSMATMVRPPPGETRASFVQDEDEDEDSASTLVHGARPIDEPQREQLDVSLQTPGGGALQVELQPPQSGESEWYIPALTDSARLAADAHQGVPDPGTMVAAAPSGPIDVADPATTAGAHAPMAFAASPVATEVPPVRSGTTLIPTESPAASSQTAGVITVQNTEEPEIPRARRPSKIVIATPTDGGTNGASIAAAAYDDSGEFVRPGADGVGEGGEDLDPELLEESADLLESMDATPSPEAPPRPPTPPAPRNEAPPPPPRQEAPPPPPRQEAQPGPPPAPPARTEPAPPPPRQELRAVTEIPEPPPQASRMPGLVTGQTLPPTDEPHWSAAVFGEHYAALARPGAERIAAAEADFVIAMSGVGAGASVIDVGSGDGMHANALSDRGMRVLGLESSPAQLRRASESYGSGLPNLRWLLGDVRQRPVTDQFDLVVCVGTTFGQYDDAQNRVTLEALRDLCRPGGGRLVLQVLNRDYVVPRLPARSWWQGQGCLVLDEVEMQDWASRVAVRRTIVFEDGRQFEHSYSLRAYAMHELVALCEAAGLRVLEASGSRHTRGRFFGATSPDIWLSLERR